MMSAPAGGGQAPPSGQAGKRAVSDRFLIGEELGRGAYGQVRRDLRSSRPRGATNAPAERRATESGGRHARASVQNPKTQKPANHKKPNQKTGLQGHGHRHG
jgi:hypothetical protein